MKLPPNVSEWLNLLTRWFHIFAAILWVGTTYYFTWLDARFHDEEGSSKGDGEKVEVWMVHSGGFYVVEKRKTPSLRRLHWFRWEAMLTWLSGMTLLIIVYYFGGLMDTHVFGGVLMSIVAGLVLIALAWVIYDSLWRSPLARNEAACTTLSFVLLLGVIFALTHMMTGRAAYIHIGAMLGTFMSANVWLRILPFQRQMVVAVKKGIPPDLSLGSRAKQRTKHNNYMIVPVVFIMISNHFPVATYGNPYNWIILPLLMIAGGLAAKVLRNR